MLVARPAAAGRRYNWELAVVDGAAFAAMAGGVGFMFGMVVAAVIDMATPAVDTRDDDATAAIFPVRGGFALGVAGSF